MKKNDNKSQKTAAGDKPAVVPKSKLASPSLKNNTTKIKNVAASGSNRSSGKSNASMNRGLAVPGTLVDNTGSRGIPQAVEETFFYEEDLTLNNAGFTEASIVLHNNAEQTFAGASPAGGVPQWGAMFQWGRVEDESIDVVFVNREAFPVFCFVFFGADNPSFTTGNVPLQTVMVQKGARRIELAESGGMDKGQIRIPKTYMRSLVGTQQVDYDNGGLFNMNAFQDPTGVNLTSCWIGIASTSNVFVNGVRISFIKRMRTMMEIRETTFSVVRDEAGKIVQTINAKNPPRDDLPGHRPSYVLAALADGGTMIHLSPGEVAVQMPNSYVLRFHVLDEVAFYDMDFEYCSSVLPYPYVLWDPRIREHIAPVDLQRFLRESTLPVFVGLNGHTFDEILEMKSFRAKLKMKRQKALLKKRGLPIPGDYFADYDERLRLNQTALAVLQSLTIKRVVNDGSKTTL